MSNRPLSHIRVLDFGHYLAGPMVGMMLADMGAEGSALILRLGRAGMTQCLTCCRVASRP